MPAVSFLHPKRTVAVGSLSLPGTVETGVAIPGPYLNFAAWANSSRNSLHFSGLQCKFCFAHLLTTFTSPPSQVSVGGVKDGQYYSGVVTVTRSDQVGPIPLNLF